MRQQINLYQPELREHRRNFSARVCLVGSGVVVAALCLIYGYGQWQVHRLEQSVEQLTLQRDAAARDLAMISQRFPAKQASPVLQAELERMDAALANGHRLLAELSGMRIGASGGFAAYLEGFARRRVEGLWLRAFRIFNGGRDLELEGSALKPELVTDLLKRLSAEEIFQGVRFRALRLERQASAPHGVDFLLGTVTDDMVAAQ
jgi:Tfp pilus assembly protein PilN